MQPQHLYKPRLGSRLLVLIRVPAEGRGRVPVGCWRVLRKGVSTIFWPRLCTPVEYPLRSHRGVSQELRGKGEV